MEDSNTTIGQVLVNLFNGRTAVFGSDKYKTIGQIKGYLLSQYTLGNINHSIWYGLNELDDEVELSELLVDESTISLDHHLELLGGGKKRKKKQYTTPKKVKHKKKKVKLAVLKYYKVDGDKVVRLLKDCPGENCGRGVFMAAHNNRTYCGRCQLTYLSPAQE
uniref:S27 ribosomal protein, putative n=1 Tax=Theileria annulata TaxID=5874 RepID=A0A3B0NAG2_THEAN